MGFDEECNVIRIKRDTRTIKRLIDAVETGLKFLPDSYYYGKKDGKSWVWEECTNEEQKVVKSVRRKMNIAIKILRKEQK